MILAPVLYRMPVSVTEFRGGQIDTAQLELLLTVRIILRCAAMDAGIKRWIIDMQSKAELFDTSVK